MFRISINSYHSLILSFLEKEKSHSLHSLILSFLEKERSYSLHSSILSFLTFFRFIFVKVREK